jgi:uncharacterized membrane protein YfcA
LLSTTTLLLVTAIIFLASFLLGITSFGFALVAVPLLNLIFPLQLLVPILIIYGVFINGLVLLPIYKHLDLKGMQYLVGAGILGVPLGTYLLLILDESILKIGIGIIIIISAWALYTGYHVNIKNEKLGNSVAGFTSGLLNGCLTMSGPPVILFYSNQNLEKQVFRANLAFYFMLTNVITLPALYWGGLLTPQVFQYSVAILPTVLVGIVGILLGSKLGTKMDGALFHRLSLILIFLMGVMSIISA